MERKKFEIYLMSQQIEGNINQGLKYVDFNLKENVAMYLMNSLNALLACEILNNNYEFFQHFEAVFGSVEHEISNIAEGFNRTYLGDFESIFLFEISKCYVNEVAKNPIKGYEALTKIFSDRYPLFQNADKMTDDELYNALKESMDNKNPKPSIYGAICCCIFLTPNPSDKRWNNFMNNQSNVYNANSVKTVREKIKCFWQIDNLDENRIFMRFLKKRRDDIATYLKCNESELHLFLLDLVFEHLNNGQIINNDLQVKKISEFCKKQFKLLEETGKENLLGFLWFIDYDDYQLAEIMNDCINQSICNLVWTKIEEKHNQQEDFGINMLIHNVLIENPEEFIKEIVTSFFFHLSCKLIKNSMIHAFNNFALDKFLQRDSSSILNDKISVLEAIIQEKDNLLKNQKQEIDGMNSKIQRLEKQLSKVTKAQESETEKKLREISNENDKLREKITIYEEFDSLMRTENEVYLDCEEEVDVTAISGKRMLFIGGRNEVVQKLKATFPNAVFVRNEIRKISFNNFERVVIFPEFMNHSMYYKYRNLIRRQGVKVVFCNTNNIEQVHKQIFMSFQEAA